MRLGELRTLLRLQATQNRPDLVDVIEELFEHRLADPIQANYGTSLRMSLQFCFQNEFSKPFRICECDVMMFCAEQTRLNHAFSTVRSYLTAINSSLRLGYDDYNKDFKCLEQLLQVMKRKLGLGARKNVFTSASTPLQFAEFLICGSSFMM